jgi:hypothetical protein
VSTRIVGRFSREELLSALLAYSRDESVSERDRKVDLEWVANYDATLASRIARNAVTQERVL